jgi:trehalose 6-phosphate synthase
MNNNPNSEKASAQCGKDPESLLSGRSLIIVSNRGPVSFITAADGSVQTERSGGGLVTALLGLAQSHNITWIASALDDYEKQWGKRRISLDDEGKSINLLLVPLESDVYDGYYNVISNPLLWFLQHSMWDFITAPTITEETWQAWDNGYVVANRLFAQATAQHIKSSSQKSLVMVQDYHLYLMPRMLLGMLRRTRRSENLTLTHFIHIPWPGPEDIRILPGKIRQSILDGLLAVDLLGFQTREDGLNFLRSVESHLPKAHVNYKHRRVWYRNHATIVRDFPISIDVDNLRRVAETPETVRQRELLREEIKDLQLILRVDRTEPSKNIVRGFKAFGDMLEKYPQHRGKVKFIALLVPSRLDVDEYRDYHDELMAAAGMVNSRYGTREWEPVRIFLGENYDRAVAALQLYDVLLVNSIADGMNLVAKEGPIVNHKDGVLVLSELAGASQQLESGALTISPCDVYATAEALHHALVMPPEERHQRADRLRWLVEENDINTWFCDQIEEIQKLGL